MNRIASAFRGLFLVGGVLIGAASAAKAQEVLDCDGWRSSVRRLAEPWEANTATFANGAVRIALIDPAEPAAASMYLLILSPPYDKLEERQCKLIGYDAGLGFAAIHFSEIAASYDPARGLTFDIPAMIVLGDGFANSALVSATLNQATGAISLTMAPGSE